MEEKGRRKEGWMAGRCTGVCVCIAWYVRERKRETPTVSERRSERGSEMSVKNRRTENSKRAVGAFRPNKDGVTEDEEGG